MMTPSNQTLKSKPTASEQISRLSRQARSLETEGRLSEAHDCYAEILGIDPTIAQAHYQFGRLAYRMRRYADAAVSLERAAKLRPTEAAVWELWTKAVARVGDAARTQRVRHMLQDAPIPAPVRQACEKTLVEVRAVPGLGEVPPDQLSLALSALRSGQLRRAVEIAEPLHKLHPEVAPVSLVLGSAQSGLGQIEEAEAAFNAAIEAAPDYAEAHHGLGRMLLARGRISEGLSAIEKAANLAPNLRAAQVTLARCLIQIERDLPRATTILRQLLRKFPDAPDVLLELGRAHVTERKMRRAIETLEQVLASGDSKYEADARLLMAQAYCDLGLFDKALLETGEAAILAPPNGTAQITTARIHLARTDKVAAKTVLERCIEQTPTLGEAYRLYAQCHKFEADDPMIEQMKAQWDNPDLLEKDRAGLGFALGKALDDTREYNSAFPYLDRANDIERVRFPFNHTLHEKRVAETVINYRETEFAIAEPTGKPAPIFVLGLPRSGGDLVEAVLGAHPRVTVGGEVGFVRNEVARVARGPDGRLRDWSKLKPIAMEAACEAIDARKQAMFQRADIVTDRSTDGHMLIGPILATIPDAKVVVVHRDLRDVALALYQTKFPDGRHAFSYDLKTLADYCQSFEALIDFWRERLPGRFHEIGYEALLENPAKVSQDLLAACGLDWSEEWQSNLPKFHNRVDRTWHRYETQLAPLTEALANTKTPTLLG